MMYSVARSVQLAEENMRVFRFSGMRPEAFRVRAISSQKIRFSSSICMRGDKTLTKGNIEERHTLLSQDNTGKYGTI